MKPAILGHSSLRAFACPLVLLVMLISLGSAQVDVPAFGPREAARSVGVSIDGPADAAAGQEITLRLVGTPAVDLGRPLLEQLDWLMGETRLYVYWMAPEVAMRPVDLRGELVFAATGATMQPVVRVTSRAAGEHRLVVDWNHGQHQLIEHRVRVGGAPDPEPPDPPSDGVTPGAVRAWLSAVPDAVRRAEMTHPISGAVLTRQDAIGQTFANIGRAGPQLGSIEAMDSMLATGLVPMLGESAADWRKFAEAVDRALAELKRAGVRVKDYSAAYLVIAEVLSDE